MTDRDDLSALAWISTLIGALILVWVFAPNFSWSVL